MSVVRTDRWLLDHYHEPIKICEKIKRHFKDDVSISAIFNYLTSHGMYRSPEKDRIQLLKTFKKNKVWEIIEREAAQLKSEWNGPSVPIFILPADTQNQKMQLETNGKSGLAFKDKLFLFISEESTETELKALFTHEYNHSCRLTSYKKEEQDMTLLDSVIMEGLAESSVRERLGKEAAAAWTNYYSHTQLERIWKDVILPHKDLLNGSIKHHHLLYGLSPYPKMGGYCTGYYLVQNYLNEYELSTKDILGYPSERIAHINR